MNRSTAVAGACMGAVVFALLAACGGAPGRRETAVAAPSLAASFEARGGAGLQRLAQDELQAACSRPDPPPAEVAQRLQAIESAAIRPPADGRYLGDWKAGAALAQSGRGLTWSDAPGDPAGGGCYNCHQLDPAELSYGTLGPSLRGYAARLGVTDPAAPAAQAALRATWARLVDAKAFNACSAMPRFGRNGILDERQLQDLMALLFDPASPVNR